MRCEIVPSANIFSAHTILLYVTYLCAMVFHFRSARAIRFLRWRDCESAEWQHWRASETHFTNVCNRLDQIHTFPPNFVDSERCYSSTHLLSQNRHVTISYRENLTNTDDANNTTLFKDPIEGPSFQIPHHVILDTRRSGNSFTYPSCGYSLKTFMYKRYSLFT